MAKIIGNTTATPNPRPDWAQTDSTKADFIKNKPVLGDLAAKNTVDKTDLAADVQESLNKADTAIQSVDNKVDKVDGKGLSTEDYTTAEKNKLDGIAAGAEVNVQSDWTQTNTGADDYIKNKPTLGSLAAKSTVAKTDLDSAVQESLNKADAALQSAQKGTANGVAELDANGKVPSAQLPSYVDDVLEYSAKASFPVTGETGKIYIDTTTNITYRWGGSTYVPIGSDLALGETSSTAYYGDKGKVAYEHSQVTSGNPHGLKYDDLLSKPFYSEYVITSTVLFPERTIEFEDGTFEDVSPCAFTENTEYTITLDGVEYTSVSALMNLGDDSIVFGNPGVLNGEDNGQPIIVIYHSSDNRVCIQMMDNATASHTVAVSQNTTTEEIHKLDPKYIHTPDVGGQINVHNTSEESHSDIRNAISQKTQVQFITWEDND